MFRYRYERGVSYLVMQRFAKVRNKLGAITRITARRYWGRYNTTHEVIMIYGTNGTARFNGVCWSYGGEGPHTVHTLLLACGVSPDLAKWCAFSSTRRGHSEIGADWDIPLSNWC